MSQRNRRRLMIETCESRDLLTVGLVADVERSNPGSFPMNLAEFDGAALFTTQDLDPTDGDNGFALYRSDGTEQGTVLLRHFPHRYFASNQFHIGNQAYFSTAFHDGQGQELWKTDGTPEGTVLVDTLSVNFQPGVSWLAIFGDHIYFHYAQGPRSGIWKSDGTSEGTARIKEGLGFADAPVVAGDALFFQASDTQHGQELWKTDGTTDGTQLVKDIRPGEHGSSIERATAVDNLLYFVADDGVHGRELWVSDSTTAGTRLVKELAPGQSGFQANGIAPSWMLGVNGLLYFSIFGPGVGQELYRSDGTVGGTALLKDINQGPFGSGPRPLAWAGDQFLFTVPELDGALWTTDGTPDGTRPYARTNEGFTWATDEVTIVSGFFNMTNQVYLEAGDGAGAFFFDAFEQPTGTEIWFDDGTAAGRQILVDGLPGPNSSVSSSGFVRVRGAAFYAGDDGTNGPELWKTDGTAEGTGMVRNIADRGSFGSSPSYPTKIDDLIYFVAQQANASGMFAGREVWVSDATEAGTRMLKDINPGPSSQPFGLDPNFTKVGDTVFFLAVTDQEGLELWKTDGTTEGTAIVRDIRPGREGSFVEVNSRFNPQQFTVLNDEIYFIANDGRGEEIWKSDGTEAGTQRVTRIRRDGGNPRIADLTVFADAIYFAADDGVNGNELWRTRGDAASTEIAATIQSGPRGSGVSNLTVVGDRLFFTAATLQTGGELWVTNGTAAGTQVVRDIRVGELSSGPDNLTHLHGSLVFTADTELGRELWISDGTLRGTQLVLDIYPGQQTSFPDALVAAGNKVYFMASTPDHGRELWVSDGTRSGTRLVKDITPITRAGDSTQVSELFAIGDRVAFLAYDFDQGHPTVWLSDGTAERTSRINGLNVIQRDGLRVSEDLVLLVADDGRIGEEIWFIDALNPSIPQVTRVVQNQGNGLFDRLDSLSFTFTHDVSASLNVNDLFLMDDALAQTVDYSADFSWDSQTRTGTWTYRDLTLAPGHYSAHLNGTDIQDGDGDLLDGNHDFEEGDDHIHRFSIFYAGDADTNGAVEFADFLKLAENFGREAKTWREGDFTGDGRVSFEDFLVLSLNFGRDSRPKPSPIAVAFAAASAEEDWWFNLEDVDGLASSLEISMILN